jgi:hypothetical protein
MWELFHTNTRVIQISTFLYVFTFKNRELQCTLDLVTHGLLNSSRRSLLRERSRFRKQHGWQRLNKEPRLKRSALDLVNVPFLSVKNTTIEDDDNDDDNNDDNDDDTEEARR